MSLKLEQTHNHGSHNQNPDGKNDGHENVIESERISISTRSSQREP
jgi:hypothetical protein